jgi:ATP adenylyltransferase
MDKLWAPWRMKYISTVDDKKEGCIFCKKPFENKDKENLILLRTPHSFVIMNRFPYNNGHLLVVPNRHTAHFHDLTDPEKLDLMQTMDRAIQCLQKVLHPDGFNTGMNLGRIAGAGIAEHIHMHIVPRWNGDTSFMSVISDTKIISESLEDGYDKLSTVFNERK